MRRQLPFARLHRDLAQGFVPERLAPVFRSNIEGKSAHSIASVIRIPT
jgi:hypothetical protein